MDRVPAATPYYRFEFNMQTPRPFVTTDRATMLRGNAIAYLSKQGCGSVVRRGDLGQATWGKSQARRVGI